MSVPSLFFVPALAFATPAQATPLPTCMGKTATTVSGDARIKETAGSDVIMITGRGTHIVWAGAGRDLIRGRSGDDTIFGNGGSDRIHGRSGNDRIQGGLGDNTDDEWRVSEVWCYVVGRPGAAG